MITQKNEMTVYRLGDLDSQQSLIDLIEQRKKVSRQKIISDILKSEACIQEIDRDNLSVDLSFSKIRKKLVLTHHSNDKIDPNYRVYFDPEDFEEAIIEFKFWVSDFSFKDTELKEDGSFGTYQIQEQQNSDLYGNRSLFD